MKLQNAINKLIKEGYEVETQNNMAIGTKDNYKITAFHNSEKVTAASVERISSGTFFYKKNLKQAFDFIATR